MNAKRWFAWACLALMLVAEILLFRANHERDAALADLREARQQLQQTQAELTDLKTSSAGLEVVEVSSLRKQNEVLTGKVAALQKNVEQLQTEQQQTALVANANACIANLREIDAAKQQWALEKAKGNDAVPTAQDLLPYLKDGVFPTCPDGGTYTLNAVGELPTCSIQGHVLTQ